MASVADAAQSNGDIMRRLRELERFVQEQFAARRLENATIGRGGIRVDEEGTIRSTTFDGDLLAENPGTAGWALGADRLVLGGQFVGPISFDERKNWTSGFALGTAITGYVGVNIPVPSWADQAIILSGHTVQVLNDTGVLAYVTLRGDIDGEGSGGVNLGAVDGTFASGSIMHSGLVNEPGSTILVETVINATGTAWGADPLNYTSVNAIALFRRGV